MKERNLTELDTRVEQDNKRAYEAPKVEAFDLNQVVRFQPGSTPDGFGGFLP